MTKRNSALIGGTLALVLAGAASAAGDTLIWSGGLVYVQPAS